MYWGVDIGGTLTDLVLRDEDGTIITAGALTTPGALKKGVLDAIGPAADIRGAEVHSLLTQIKAFGQGTIPVTNALIERTGARTSLHAASAIPLLHADLEHREHVCPRCAAPARIQSLQKGRGVAHRFAGDAINWR